MVLLEYAKQSRAKCRSCGETIQKSLLRFGSHVPSNFGDGETLQYRHFGCLDRSALQTLGGQAGVGNVRGYNTLTAEDQAMVSVAATLLNVPEEHVTPSMRPMPSIPENLVAASSSQAAPSSTQIPEAASTSRKRPAPDEDEIQGRVIREEDEEEETPDEVQDVFYIRFNSDVVGVQHYQGLVGVGEAVNLIREPNNAYDRNAIRVNNLARNQVGHIPRATAANLARLLDRNLISAEGTMLTGNLNFSSSYKLKVAIDIYGPPSSRESLAPHLAWAGTLSDSGIAPPRGEPAQMQVSGTSLSPKKKGRKTAATPQETEAQKQARKIQESLKDLEKKQRTNDGVMDLLTKSINPWKLPAHPSPPSIANGLLLNDLLHHQSQALAWMIERENPRLPPIECEATVQFWQRRAAPQPHWFNLASKTPQNINDPPSLNRGGIMADAMGLGKTIVMLSLILATAKEAAPGYSKATLIVCPLSVLSNWETQIKQHIAIASNFQFMVYHGDGRNATQNELEGCDAVITTYNVLSAEFKDKEKSKSKKHKGANSGILDIKWKRVALDEGHTIRNPTAGMSKACHSLIAHRRWVVSGTPIVNGAKDLGSLLQFLKICQPLDNPDQFKRLLMRPLAAGDSHGSEVLQSFMTDNCLRRTKEMEDENGNRLVPLPPVEFYVVPVELHKADREAYDMAMAASKRAFEKYITEGREAQLPPNVLELLTRLRQLALVNALLPEGYIDNICERENKHTPAVQLTPDVKLSLQRKLKSAIEDSEECPICFDTLAQPRITLCGHTFCLPCITEVIKVQQKCPMDRTDLPSDGYIIDLPEDLPENDVTENAGLLGTSDQPLPTSAKIEELLKYLTAFNDGQKSLVFSQFTKFLSYIEPHLVKAGIPVIRFDGSMNAKKRAEVIADFQRPVPPEQIAAGWEPAGSGSKGKGKKKVPIVMLISLKAGSMGLNLTAAQNVFLMDPWWQSAIELQAIDRVNRIGQKAAKVQVFQMIAKDTLEQKVLEIQERKNELIQQAFSGHQIKETAKQKKEARFHEMQELFGIAPGPAPPPGAGPRLLQTTLR